MQGDVEKLQNYAKLTNQTGSHLLRYTDTPSILQPNILEASPATHHIGCDSMMSYTIRTMVEIVKEFLIIINIRTGAIHHRSYDCVLA